ncbi:tRNA (cytidine(34)-2'-O)-methyltransferase [Cyanobium sp. NIES-981]|uniref:tRNA (cytidine(34)-2'-O)-methyltransferase n=1 Tax=Cyanobium sp. NIES-981 TaxID=1851505 RepID=UPI0007DD271F|nr:tRNA (cytidine(34)-2'-O)-methyltransferase [Cyanobium sp. NIES-981]SBO42304.1 putative tRNA (cytidine(34)-2'-O)-methyltransferase [Cyanobium sp. NIES-981]
MPRVVLYQPQIPPNTGNVARTCAATAQELHLVGPLGFEISDRTLRRAGLDYWPYVALTVHPDWQAFDRQRRLQGGRLLALSAHGSTPYTAFPFQPDDWLLFGRETDGLPQARLEQADALLTIPMRRSRHHPEGGVRSLNLSVAVGVVLFEALRQENGPPDRC